MLLTAAVCDADGALSLLAVECCSSLKKANTILGSTSLTIILWRMASSGKPICRIFLYCATTNSSSSVSFWSVDVTTSTCAGALLSSLKSFAINLVSTPSKVILWRTVSIGIPAFNIRRYCAIIAPSSSVRLDIVSVIGAAVGCESSVHGSPSTAAIILGWTSLIIILCRTASLEKPIFCIFRNGAAIVSSSLVRDGPFEISCVTSSCFDASIHSSFNTAAIILGWTLLVTILCRTASSDNPIFCNRR